MRGSRPYVESLPQLFSMRHYCRPYRFNALEGRRVRAGSPFPNQRDPCQNQRQKGSLVTAGCREEVEVLIAAREPRITSQQDRVG